MPTQIYLSNDPSDVSGYLRAYINTRSPNASTTPTEAVTNTTANILTTTDDMTITAGGSTTLKWITAPLEDAVTLSTIPLNNIWAKESNALANAHVALEFSQYTTSLQTAYLVTSLAAELTTSMAQIHWLTTTSAGKESITSTAFSAGDRLAIVPGIGGYTGQTGTSQTVTMAYNGLGDGYPGDSWILIQETLRANEAQVGGGQAPGIRGVGVSYFNTLAGRLNSAVGAGLIGTNATVQMILDECGLIGGGTDGQKAVH